MVEESEENVGGAPKVGIPLDVIDNIIADLNANDELRAVFGEPVCRNLVIAAIKMPSGEIDLRIEESGSIGLSKEQSDRFVEVLSDVIKANSV
jgi:hypothetical protein